MLYPMRFKKVFIEKVWGGRAFEEKLNMQLPKIKILENLGKFQHIQMEWELLKMGLLREKLYKKFIPNTKIN